MKVAVVGAGASGLAAMKSCLEEGLEPTCYEKCDYIGGLWHYSPVVVPGDSSVMNCTVSNVSKEMMCYSDFPAPKDFPVYMPHPVTDRYLELYADTFGLGKHIKTNHEVLEIKESSDHVTSGKWVIKVKDRNTDRVEENDYDFVMVCSGIFGRPNIPEVQGISTFKGRVLHSHSYRDTRGFEDQNVLVVGFGNSAGDAAVDVASVAKQVYMSSRNGGWLMQRVNKHGLPLDLDLSRLVQCLLNLAPNLITRLVEHRLNSQVNHNMYGFNPEMSINKLTGCLNDDLPVRVLNGTIRMKPNIKTFTHNGVEFVDDTKHEVDSVIFATGYDVTFPFLSDDVIGVDKSGFYKGIFPTGRERNTLAIIGCVRLRGGVLPIVEMQSRVAVKVFTEDIKLTSNEEMLKEISLRKAKDSQKKIAGLDYIQQCDFIPYLDELAEMIGCKPKIGQLLVRDPRLAMKCIFGPCSPCQYRLFGPHPWAGARDAILTLMDRVYFPLNPEYPRELDKKGGFPVFKLGFLLVAIVATAYYIIY